MSFIDDYFDLQQRIHNYFGYVEDWKVIPLVDFRDMYWILKEESDGSGEIDYNDKPLENGYDEEGDYYNATIYTQRFLPKWVYRAEDYTMVCMDTHCDDNKFLGIFDNNKEHKNITP